MQNGSSKRNVVAVVIFVLGIAALAILLFYSFVLNFSPVILAIELVVLLSLIGLLVFVLLAMKKEREEALKNLRSPYGEVNIQEIESIFKMIDEEDRKRGRTPVYTTPAKAQSSDSDDASADFGADVAQTEQPASAESAAAAEPEEEEDRLPIIFPDKDEYDNEPKPFTPLSEERAAARRQNDEKKTESSPDSDEISELAAAAAAAGLASLGDNDSAENDSQSTEQSAEDGKGGDSMDNNGRPRRRPVDPSRQRPGVYYDAYGRPVQVPLQQQPVSYDAYGRPIYAKPPAARAPQKKPRAPIGYDAYGRPVYAQPQKKPRTPIGYDAYGRPIYAQQPAAARPPQQQQQRRRRPPMPGQPGAPAQGQPAAPQIPTEPVAASAESVLASFEAQQTSAKPANYYDDDYIPVVVHVDDDSAAYDESRYMPRVRAGVGADPNTPAPPPSYGYTEAPASRPLASADEYNYGGGEGGYTPDYSDEEVPIVVPSFEDMEVDYSTPSSRFSMPPSAYDSPYAKAPNYSTFADADIAPEAPAGPVRSRQALDPQFNSTGNSDYRPDSDEETFVYVPHFDDDDPIPEKAPAQPQIPHFKIAKMRRRKVKRRSRRGMLFKVHRDRFEEYIHNLNTRIS